MRTCSLCKQLPRRHRRCDLGVVLAALLGGCTTPPPAYRPLPPESARIVHCFDGVPHQPGTGPWILGGTCCCTPTDAMLAVWQRDGFAIGLTTDEVIQMYRDKGIALALDHTLCNNFCEYGPHVTQGGRCMVPPTPGTWQFELVVTGGRRPIPTTTAPATAQAKE